MFRIASVSVDCYNVFGPDGLIATLIDHDNGTVVYSPDLTEIFGCVSTWDDACEILKRRVA